MHYILSHSSVFVRNMFYIFMGVAVYAKALAWRSGCVEVRGQLVEPTMWVLEVKLRSLGLEQAPLPGELPHCPSFIWW